MTPQEQSQVDAAGEHIRDLILEAMSKYHRVSLEYATDVLAVYVTHILIKTSGVK